MLITEIVSVVSADRQCRFGALQKRALHREHSKSLPPVDRLTFSTPRRPYERERLDQELRICGEYGLRNKREIWRVQLVLAKIRKVVEGRKT